MDNEKTEMKPCPFCGEKAQLSFLPRWGYWVKCENMGCDVMPTTICFITDEDAIRAWNKRAE